VLEKIVFTPGQKVLILDTNTEAEVREVIVDQYYVSYKVEWWENAKLHRGYYDKEDLSIIR